MSLIRVNHKDRALLPAGDDWQDVQLAELIGTREYVKPHPFFPVEIRGRAAAPGRRGDGKEWAYPGDYQLRLRGGGWPDRWLASRDLIGTIHSLCFCAEGGRDLDALARIQAKLTADLRRFGIEPRWPHDYMAETAEINRAIREEFGR